MTNLFNPTAPLVDAERWMGTPLARKHFGVVARVLKSLLPMRSRDKLTAVARARRRRIVFRMFGDTVALSELSDGYQALLSMAADMLSVLLPVWKDRVQSAEGIVLVDELDAHLHPVWRKRVVSDLRKCFPNVQFITTTHDPLCLMGLQAGEVAVLRRTPNNRIIAVRHLPSPAGMSTDQLLTSEHFGLSSVRDPETSQLFDDYYRLLAKKKLSKAETTRLDDIQERLRRRHYMGQTRREQMMLEVIDAYLADTPPTEVEEQRQRCEVTEATLRKVYAGRPPRRRA